MSLCGVGPAAHCGSEHVCQLVLGAEFVRCCIAEPRYKPALYVCYSSLLTRGYVVRKAYKLYQLGGVVSEILYSPAAYGLDMSVKNMPKPRARISPQIAVAGNTLWLLGGVVEVGESEITLDDMWSLDLVKLDGWQLVKENTVGEEVFKAAAAKVVAGGDDSSGWEEASSDEEA
eukprot:GHRQ01016668.1.p1 GENE.GHRQ01016668.1~~GHRQ01016668.1.p1  ORF type:complete len:174 (+),score=48.83 GHRQ01016668.1:370-891(+)